MTKMITIIQLNRFDNALKIVILTARWENAFFKLLKVHGMDKISAPRKAHRSNSYSDSNYKKDSLVAQELLYMDELS